MGSLCALEEKEMGENFHGFLAENQSMIQAMAHLNKCLCGEIAPEYLALPQEAKDKIDAIIKRMFQGE